MKKKRADIVLFEKGLVESLEKGKKTIMEGKVFVGNERVDKPGDMIDIDSPLRVKKDPIVYVSRGGLKLEKAIHKFDIDLKNKTAMDIGSSTGGFTDCMLKNGVKKIYAVDVGYGQLDWKLRQDSRVVVKERTNIRYVTENDIGEKIDFISIDVSFISLKLVLPVAKKLLLDNGYIVALIKPQFEAKREQIGPKGIIKDKDTHFDLIKSIVEFCKSINLNVIDIEFSPITGAKGNIEFLSYISKDMTKNPINDMKIFKTLDSAHNSF